MTTINEALEGAAPEEPKNLAPEPEANVPADDGQDVAEGVSESTEPAYFDPSEFADRKAKVKVQDEELEVPVPELVQGYMRQADYTRKTQELAQARALWDNLNQDPESTIRELALRQLAAQSRDREQVEELPDDPVQREIYELRDQVQRLHQMEEDRQLYREIQQLQTKYGDSFDLRSVANRAYQSGSYDLEGTFLQMQGEKYWAAQAALRDDASERQQADAAVTAAKAEASLLAGGASARSGGAPIDVADRELSTAEAFREALRIHGITDVRALREA